MVVTQRKTLDIVVTYLTIAYLQLQVINPIYIEELLLVDYPRSTQRIEGTPTVLLCEA